MLQTMAFAVTQVIPNAVKTGLFVSSCSVFQQDGNIGTSGAPSGLYDVSVISNVPCMDAPPRDAAIQASEVRGIVEIQSKGLRHVLLAGYYYDQLFPLIQQGLQAVVVDPDQTTTYNVFGVEPDSQNTQTRLHLEVISV